VVTDYEIDATISNLSISLAAGSPGLDEVEILGAVEVFGGIRRSPSDARVRIIHQFDLASNSVFGDGSVRVVGAPDFFQSADSLDVVTTLSTDLAGRLTVSVEHPAWLIFASVGAVERSTLEARLREVAPMGFSFVGEMAFSDGRLGLAFSALVGPGEFSFFSMNTPFFLAGFPASSPSKCALGWREGVWSGPCVVLVSPAG
jgi:hypothetical protein